MNPRENKDGLEFLCDMHHSYGNVGEVLDKMRYRFGYPSDTEWNFLLPYVIAVAESIGLDDFKEITSNRLRVLVLGKLAEAGQDELYEYVEHFDAMRNWKILDTWAWEEMEYYGRNNQGRDY